MTPRLAAGAALLALVTSTGPAYAGGDPQSMSMAFDEPVATAWVDGLGPGCPDFTGTLTEHRHLVIDGWLKPDGTGHARTDVTAQVTLVPDDAGAPSYAGSYVSHQTGQFVAFGDDERVVTTTTHGTLVGSDGSRIRIAEVARVGVDGQGRLRTWFDRFHCS